MRVPDPITVRRAFINTSRSKAASMSLPAPWPPARAEDRDFLGWVDPKAPRRAYIVIEQDAADELVSIELRLSSAPAIRRRLSMCDVCHTSDASAGSLLMVAPRAGPRGRNGDSVGIYICSDFACSLRAREPLKTQERSLTGMPDLRIPSAIERMTAFVDRVRS